MKTLFLVPLVVTGILILNCETASAESYKCRTDGKTGPLIIQDIAPFSRYGPSNSKKAFIKFGNKKITGVFATSDPLEQKNTFHAEEGKYRVEVTIYYTDEKKAGSFADILPTGSYDDDGYQRVMVDCKKIEDSAEYKRDEAEAEHARIETIKKEPAPPSPSLSIEDQKLKHSCNWLKKDIPQTTIKDLLGSPSKVETAPGEEGENDTWIYEQGARIKFRWKNAMEVTLSEKLKELCGR